MANLETVSRACAHLSKRLREREFADYQPFLDCLTDDVAFEFASPEGAGLLEGKAAVNDHIASLFSSPKVEDVWLEEHPEYFVGEGRVLVRWVEVGRDIASGVVSRPKEVVIIFELSHGKVHRLLKLSQ